MISHFRSVLAALYLSSCAVASSSVVSEEHVERFVEATITNVNTVVGYAGSTTLDSSLNNALHGFKFGLRSESCLQRYHLNLSETGAIRSERVRVPFSTEVSFRGLFGEERNLYEFGLTNGIRILGENNDHNLEILAGPARMGISEGQTYWTPQAGLGYNLWPFQAQVGADFYVGKERGVGLFVNGGLGF